MSSDDIIRSAERTNTAPAKQRRTKAQTTPQVDVPAAESAEPTTAPKRGAYVWRTNTAMHSAHTEWDPTAEPVEAQPLSISRTDMQLLIAIAKRISVPIAKLNGIDPAAVREARAFAAQADEFANKFEKYEQLIEACR